VTDAQRQLHEALKARKFELEIARGAAPDYDLEERIETAWRVLQWLEQATFRQARPEACTLYRGPHARPRVPHGNISAPPRRPNLKLAVSIRGQGPSQAR
jgi:hypothetical protein